MTFSRIGDVAELQAMDRDWDALFARAGQAELGFQTHACTLRWARHYAGAGKLHIVAGHAGGRLEFVWPLIVKRALGVTMLEHLGEPFCQYHYALIGPCESSHARLAAAIGNLVASGADLLRLRRVRADSAVGVFLLGAGAEVYRAMRAPYVDLVDGRVAQGESDRGKFASSRRRRLKKLETLGSVRFELAEAARIVGARLHTAMALKRAWAMKNGRLALAPFDGRFEALFADAAVAGDLRVFSILVGDRPVGVEVSLSSGRRLIGHLLAHDHELAAYGIGAVLADASIRAARTEGYEIFDLLAPADPYKRAWADGEIDVFDLQFPLTRRGRWLAQVRNASDMALRAAASCAPRGFVRAVLAHRQTGVASR